jgi:lipoate-protein ligase A
LTWRVIRARGRAADLFAPRDYDGVPTVVVCQVESPALVLGSTQPASVVVPASPVDVVRRRSGGGAVLVGPDHVFWVDVFVPTGHALWEADVGRAFWWLGDVWAETVRSLGVDGAVVHRGPLITTPWSPLVCFAGLGPGEVTVRAGDDKAGGNAGGKAVGMAQRRTREGSLFQCALALSWSPEQMLALLDLPDDARRGAQDELRHVAHPIGSRTVDDCTMALLGHLP